MFVTNKNLKIVTFSNLNACNRLRQGLNLFAFISTRLTVVEFFRTAPKFELREKIKELIRYQVITSSKQDRIG